MKHLQTLALGGLVVAMGFGCASQGDTESTNTESTISALVVDTADGQKLAGSYDSSDGAVMLVEGILSAANDNNLSIQDVNGVVYQPEPLFFANGLQGGDNLNLIMADGDVTATITVESGDYTFNLEEAEAGTLFPYQTWCL